MSFDYTDRPEDPMRDPRFNSHRAAAVAAGLDGYAMDFSGFMERPGPATGEERVRKMGPDYQAELDAWHPERKSPVEPATPKYDFKKMLEDVVNWTSTHKKYVGECRRPFSSDAGNIIDFVHSKQNSPKDRPDQHNLKSYGNKLIGPTPTHVIFQPYELIPQNSPYRFNEIIPNSDKISRSA